MEVFYKCRTQLITIIVSQMFCVLPNTLIKTVRLFVSFEIGSTLR